MADNQQFDESRKQAERLNRQLESLGGTAIKNIDDFIKGFGGGIEGASKAIENLKNQIKGLDTDINYFAESLKKVTNELSKQTNLNKNIEKNYKSISDVANQLKNDQDLIATLNEKSLKSIQQKLKIEKDSLLTNIKLNQERKDEIITQLRSNNLDLNSRQKLRKELTEINKVQSEARGFTTDSENGLNKLIETAKKRLQYEKEINSTLGISGKIVDGIVNSLGKLGISSEFFENLKEDMREAAKEGSKLDVFKVGLAGVGKGLGQALKDPITQLTILQKVFSFFLNSAINANKESVNLSKNLGLSEVNANKLREHFVDIELSSNNLNVTTKALVAAQNQIAEATGYFATNNDEALQTQIMLTEQFGLTAEEASNIYKFSVLNKTTSKAVNDSMVGAFVAAKNQLKVNVPFKATLAEAAKVSGQLASNLKNNPAEIVKAVVASKALGTSLEQAKNQGAALLDFQSSIENELKAELITGEKLNLERARAYALAGDQVGVARELANQGMTSAKFNSMNVIAQDSYAKALGLTSDELANQLTKRELARKSGESLAQQTKRELLEAQQRQDVQEKFNKAMERLQSIVGNLVAGPLGSMLESLSNGLLYIDKIATAFGKVGATIRGVIGKNIGGKLGELASVATIGTLIGLVTTSMFKGTLINPMITKELGIGGMGGSGMSSLGMFVGRLGKIIGVLGLAVSAFNLTGDIAKNVTDPNQSVGGGLLKSAWDNKFMLLGGILGGVAAAMTGGAALPAIGLGSSGGALIDSYFKEPETQQVPDGVATSGGPFQIRNKYGQTAITKEGDKLAVSPNISNSTPMDLSPMISAINQVTAAVNKLEQKSWNVNLDSKAVGTGLIQKSYRSA